MPKFNFVLQLDDDEKEELQGACDTKVFSAAIKAHDANVKDEIKALSSLQKQQVTQEQLELAQLAVPKIQELMGSLSDSEAKSEALDALRRAEGTLTEIQQAVASASPNS